MSDVEDDDIPSDEEQQELAEPVICPLTLDVVRGGLSVLSRTPSSIEHVYARLDVRDKTLSDIAVLSNYAHLRFIDISHNRVDDLSPLNACEMLCTLDASNNQISHFRLTTHRYLQQLDLSQVFLELLRTSLFVSPREAAINSRMCHSLNCTCRA